MTSSPRYPVCIRGCGSYAPETVLTNAFFASYLDTSDDWIIPRTGIRERRKVSDNESTGTMAAMAGRRAIESAGLSPGDIDLLVICTTTPETPIPSTACWVQARLGLRHTIPAIDLNAACSGFVYGIGFVIPHIISGLAKNALVIGAETLTRFTDYEDRSTCILFGDGAGGVVLSPSTEDDRGVLHFEMGADGSRAEDIWVPAGGSRLPASRTTVDERLHFMRMKGRELFRFAVTKMQELIDRALEVSGMSAAELKLVIPHQSNLRIINAARERLGLPEDKVAVNIDRFGNTSAASIGMALDEAMKSGRIGPGDPILLVAFGAGVTWASVLIRV